ncbi:MAG: Arm DNA-binding domain-containing protein [Paludibacter sp.]|nr:Arm DNA-binding domain-containing protein [Paludibacter sp.]
MKSTKIVLDKHLLKKNGKYPLKLRFNFKDKQIFIQLGINIEEKNFTDGKIKGTDKNLNNVIAAKKLQINSLLQNLELKNELHCFYLKLLKKFLENGSEIGNNEKEKPNYHFLTKKYSLFTNLC